MIELSPYEFFVKQLHDELAGAEASAFALCEGMHLDKVRVLLYDGTECFFYGPYTLELDPVDTDRLLLVRHRYSGEVAGSYNGNWVYAAIERPSYSAVRAPLADDEAWILESIGPDARETDKVYMTHAFPACKPGWWSTLFLDALHRNRILAVAGPHACWRGWHRSDFFEGDADE